MRKFGVAVSQIVLVTLDETKFDEAFMQEFRDSFYPFKTIEEHVKRLAMLKATGVLDLLGDEFIEGYGLASEMGISCVVVDTEEEIL